MKKVIISTICLFALVATLLVPSAKGQFVSYYFGDTIVFNGKIIIGTVNTGNFELFTVSDNKIIKAVSLSSEKEERYGDIKFYDSQFNIENNRLFVYLVDGPYLYKYDITNQTNPKLISKTKDNSWDWFIGLDKQGANIATIGNKGIKVWNNQMQIINAYNLFNNQHRNISFSENGQFIFNITEGKLQIYDTNTRQAISETSVNIERDNYRAVYNDSAQGRVYIADDKALRKLSFSSKPNTTYQVKQLSHATSFGYDVAGLDASDYVYYTNGTYVSKVNKNTFDAELSIKANELGQAEAWAMGLNVVKDSSGEKLVVFNHKSIMLLDANLKLINQYEVDSNSFGEKEDLWLTYDKSKAAPNSNISLRGKGFGESEDLVIKFDGSTYKIQADAKGRFEKIITVPNYKAGLLDIKVNGVQSGKTYSISFQIL